jgi:2-polyprenyl-3-methyl-5-hydroxy-6-metoxy-1,4-benzoquinol methylase
VSEVERPGDWDAQWRATPRDLAVPDEEARTPRWHAQERIVRERLGGFDGVRAIEIGAGRGANGVLYAERGAKVTLLDISELPLTQARPLFESRGLEFEPVVADAFDLPDELLGAFDVSMSFGLCEHFLGERRRAIVAAHVAVLRPGGIAFIGVPNRHAPIYRLWMATLKRTGTWPFGTEEPYTAAELARLARAAGGEPLDPAYGSFLASVVSHGANQLLYKLGRPGLRVPQVALPLVDRLGYELLLPIVRP